MAGWGSRRSTRLVAVVVLVGSLSGAAPVAAQADDDEPEFVDWWDDLGDAESTGDPAAPPFTPAESAPVAQDEPVAPAIVELPEAGVVDVSPAGP